MSHDTDETIECDLGDLPYAEDFNDDKAPLFCVTTVGGYFGRLWWINTTPGYAPCGHKRLRFTFWGISNLMVRIRTKLTMNVSIEVVN